MKLPHMILNRNWQESTCKKYSSHLTQGALEQGYVRKMDLSELQQETISTHTKRLFNMPVTLR